MNIEALIASKRLYEPSHRWQPPAGATVFVFCEEIANAARIKYPLSQLHYDDWCVTISLTPPEMEKDESVVHIGPFSDDGPNLDASAACEAFAAVLRLIGYTVVLGEEAFSHPMFTGTDPKSK